MKELWFFRRIRTSSDAPAAMPLFIDTVQAAIDQVQELPNHILDRDHWQAAKEALWAAVDNPEDDTKLNAARNAFCAAMEEEAWLNELKPM